MVLFLALLPLGTQRRGKSIALICFVDVCHLNPNGQWLSLCINLRTANDPDIACSMALRQRCLQAARSVCTFRLPVGLTCNDDVGTAGKGAKFWRD